MYVIHVILNSFCYYNSCSAKLHTYVSVHIFAYLPTSLWVFILGVTIVLVERLVLIDLETFRCTSISAVTELCFVALTFSYFYQGYSLALPFITLKDEDTMN